MPIARSTLLAFAILLSPSLPASARSLSKFAAEPEGAVARALASVGPSGESKLDGPLKLAASGSVDESLKALDALSAGASPDDAALYDLAAGGIALRADRLADGIARFESAIRRGSQVWAGYARFLKGAAAQDAGRLDEAGSALEASLSDDDLPPQTALEAKIRLGQIAASEKKWGHAAAVFRPLLRKLRGSDHFPEAVFQLYRSERALRGSERGRCKLARELYAKYPTLPALASWGLNLASNQVDGERVGCAASPKDVLSRIRRLQWGGESERALREIQELRANGPKAVVASASPDDADASADSSEETAEEDPADYSADSMLANYLINEGRPEEALKLLMPHYQERRNRPGFLLLIAKAAARGGENATAVGAFYRAYEASPRSKDGRNALFQSAFMSYQFQDYDGAARKFEQFMKAFSSSSLARDARWHLAWIRYLRGDFAGAYESFEKLERAKPARQARRRSRRQLSGLASDAIGGDRVRYWKAMCLLRMGKANEAAAAFQKIARDPALGYYGIAAFYRRASIPSGEKAGAPSLTGQLASTLTEEELRAAEAAQAEEATADSAGPEEAEPAVAGGEPPGEGAAVPGAVVGEPGSVKTASPSTVAKRFIRARALSAAGFAEHARRELAEIERRARSPEDRKALMAAYRALGNWHRASLLGETAFAAERLRGGLQKARDLWEHAYPRAFGLPVAGAAGQTGIAPDLIWSIMRAESHYRPEVLSPVGAMGLMQLMPFTAKRVADLMGAGAKFKPRSLLEPEANIRLGARYLQRLSDNFKGAVPLVAAAYNAGPHRVQAWLRSFGLLEMDEFIEHIPFMETRNYAKKVVRNYQIYGLLYGGPGRSAKWLAKPVGVAVDASSPIRENW